MDVIAKDMLKVLMGSNTKGTMKIYWNQTEELYRIIGIISNKLYWRLAKIRNYSIWVGVT